ncbi:MAG: SusC/RagA family TonB-linked outer membrane protein [Rikenellaceae bacterium]|nr:SusC/RagA family TonB-linked outer membrane protein [Rikenellaceae bacterium]
MRLFVSVLFTTIALSLSAQTQKKISLQMENATVENILNEIERQTDYLFVCESLDMSRRMSVDLKDKSVEEALSHIFDGTGVSWKVTGSNIYLFPKTENKDKVSDIVTGTVLDNFGEPLIGAAVLVKGTTIGAGTDLDGKFEFQLPADLLSSDNVILEFSCLGYKNQEIKLGNKRVFEVKLADDSIMMEGTVVTALGIKRSEKALSYNVQEIKADDLVSNKDANFINSLNGKVAGLNINASSSGVGGATKVIMRGQKSISQSSNALYVIDGVPMYTTAREGGTQFDSQGSTDPIADINPEDIESISVLTGAAAAALYGSDAANGAIVVTTKKGKEGKLIVNASAGVEIMNPFVLPRFQNRYGTGDLNSSIGSDVRSYGNLMNSSNNPGYDPAKDYFRTGATYTESVSVSTGNEKNQTYISGSAIDSDGIVPNNGYHRYNFTFRNTTSFLKDKMHLDVGASYIIQKDRNTTNQGTYNNPLVGAYIFPRGTDWEDIRMYERYDVTRRLYTQYWPIGDAGMTMQNPYWINYRNLRENRKDRYMLNASLSYEILDWLNIAGRVRVDNSTNKYTEKFYASTLPQLTESSKNGLYGISTTKDSQIYADVLLNIDKRFNGDWTLQANIGASITDMRYDAFKNRGPIADGEMSEEKPGLANVFNVQNLSNSQKTSRLQEGWREQTQSVFGSAEVGYKGAYYLTLTARNDWPSQLAGPHSNKKSFFYPSVGASVVLSQIIPNMPENLEYLKIRGSYASVGTAFERYIANPMYKWNSSGLSWNTQTQYPMYDLKPELTDSWEIGLSMRFLKWFSLEATYYHTNTKNQTFNPQISTGSGSSEIYIQSGDVMNQGCEISLGFGKDWNKFRWDSNLAFSTNQNKIISLADNVLNAATGEYFSVDQLDMNGLGLAHFILRKGGTLGDLYSFADFKYDSNGMIVVNEDGTVSPNMIAEAKDYVKLGSVLPKANLSWRNDFRIAGFNFGFLITARFGGIVYSSTQAVLDYYGVSEASAAARDAGGVFINGGDRVDANKWYSSVGGSNPLPQEYTYSGTNVRLQEASIGYTFPRKMLGNVCDLNLSIVGRNLWMIYNRAPFDPESVATTGNYYQGIDHFMMPSLRNFGFNVRITF